MVHRTHQGSHVKIDALQSMQIVLGELLKFNSPMVSYIQRNVTSLSLLVGTTVLWALFLLLYQRNMHCPVLPAMLMEQGNNAHLLTRRVYFLVLSRPCN